jgi:hypothetical protein
MGTLVYPTGEGIKDERCIKDLREGSIKHLVDQPVSNTSSADIALWRIKYMKVLIRSVLVAQRSQVLMQLEDQVLYIVFKILHVFSVSFTSFKMLPSQHQIFNGNHLIK